MQSYEEKKEALKRQIKQYVSEDVIVAFSGGVDSSLLLKMAGEAAEGTGRNVYGIMFQTKMHPSGEASDAEKIADECGVKFRILKTNELYGAEIAKNPVDRCYRCKRYLFQKLLEEGKKLGIETVLEGTNEDDLHVYRPGIKAIRELDIKSPLADAGLTKEEVRRLAGEYGISSAKKPSAPCLATRFPYGTELSYQAMRKVEEAETFLKSLGLYNVRLRIHGNIARIEVDIERMPVILEDQERITKYLKNLGYEYVTLDLEGFRSGSMDYAIEK